MLGPARHSLARVHKLPGNFGPSAAVVQAISNSRRWSSPGAHHILGRCDWCQFVDCYCSISKISARGGTAEDGSAIVAWQYGAASNRLAGEGLAAYEGNNTNEGTIRNRSSSVYVSPYLPCASPWPSAETRLSGGWKIIVVFVSFPTPRSVLQTNEKLFSLECEAEITLFF